jgi:hypothetical protein
MEDAAAVLSAALLMRWLLAFFTPLLCAFW